MLTALGVGMVALRDRFPPDTDDVDFLRALGGSDYVLVSLDRRQLTRIAEASALRAAGISAMYFGPFYSDLGFWKQAEYLVRFWENWLLF